MAWITAKEVEWQSQYTRKTIKMSAEHKLMEQRIH